MRSQKISNKPPRPFKNSSSDRGWAGGNRNDAAQHPKKPLLISKKAAAPAAEAEAVPASTPAGESVAE
ncbi:MAG: hypothetical protein JWO94_851 [Verrucomicrobiaceae bacterium]|nr:hypothetical protein [Verrucomicrobiaceae bacterium]